MNRKEKRAKESKIGKDYQGRPNKSKQKSK